jgi:hypothetical protein
MGLPPEHTYHLNCESCKNIYFSRDAFPKLQLCYGCLTAQLARTTAAGEGLAATVLARDEIHDCMDCEHWELCRKVGRDKCMLTEAVEAALRGWEEAQDA